MIQITKIVEWDMGHRVPNHHSKCRNPHGHRYRLELTVTGALIETPGGSSEGMVVDFGKVKQAMMERVHDVLDHGFMYYDGDEVMARFFAAEAADLRGIAVPFIPTAELLAKWCHDQLCDVLPDDLRIVQARVFETPNSWADYRPG